MDFPYLAALLYNTPLLMTMERADILESVFRAHVENPAAVVGRRGEIMSEHAAYEAELLSGGVDFKRADAGYYLQSDGLARVPMFGTFLQRGGDLDAASGMQGYNRMHRMIGAAMADPGVRGILLEVDSPGGSAAGAFDLAAEIRAWSREKPIHAFANERAQSAAYLLASAADVVTAPKLGSVGSIGVVAMHADRSERDKRDGVKWTPIYSGKRKIDLNAHFPLTDDARARVQAMVDATDDAFVGAVASFRRMDADKVRGLDAGTFQAAEAHALGLVDAEGNLAAAVARLSEATSKGATVAPGFSPRAGAMSASHSTGERNIMDPETNTGAPAAPAATAAAPAQPQPDAIRAQERARVAAILASPEADGRRAMAQHLACSTSMSADDAVALLKTAPKETPAPAAAAPAVNLLAAHMTGQPNAKVGSDVAAAQASGAGGEPSEAELAASILAFAPKARAA